jgi:hypothetical protein
VFRSRIIITLAVAAAIVFASASIATAEFSSSSSTGEGQSIEFELEAGGVTVLCGEGAVGETTVLWKIEKGEEAATKGANLVLDMEKLGRCTATTKTEEGEATATSCETVAVQPKEELKIKASIHVLCKFTFRSCEIKFGPAENNEREEVTLADSGEKAENLMLNFLLRRITTTVSSRCESLGITATKEGTITAETESYKLAAQQPAPAQFSVGTTQRYFGAPRERATIGITNLTRTDGLTATITTREDPVRNAPAFTLTGLARCQRAYEGGELCNFVATYNGPLTPFTYYYITAAGPNRTPFENYLF